MQLPIDATGTQVSLELKAGACGDYPPLPNFEDIACQSRDELTYADVIRHLVDEDAYMSLLPVTVVNGANQRTTIPMEDGLTIVITLPGVLTSYDTEYLEQQVKNNPTYDLFKVDVMGINADVFSVLQFSKIIDRKLTNSMVGVYAALQERAEQLQREESN